VCVTHDVQGSAEPFVLGMLGPGQYFGELAVISEGPRTATVTAVSETEVLEISKQDFERAFVASPALARTLLNTMIQIIRNADKRTIEDLEARNRELAHAYAELEAAQADRIAKAALEAQLEVAAEAQRSLLPTTLPAVDGFGFAAAFEPARQIGGDCYDAHAIPDGRVSVLLADVSGKGAHAALFMAVTRTLFLTEQRYLVTPGAVIRAVHRGLVEASTYDMFVTAIYGILDPRTREFRYVRGGHEEPLLVRSTGEAQFLGGRGRFLGLWAEDEPQIEEQQVILDPGDCLVIYSDGVIDMRNPAGEPFGRDELARLVRSTRTASAEHTARSIHQTVRQHRGEAEAFDDFTLLVIRAN
jgi:serine phosphatase RsbU (regulator of sigma subunit)